MLQGKSGETGKFPSMMGRRDLEPVVTDKRNASIGQKALVLPQSSPLLHPGQASLLALPSPRPLSMPHTVWGHIRVVQG